MFHIYCVDAINCSKFHVHYAIITITPKAAENLYTAISCYFKYYEKLPLQKFHILPWSVSDHTLLFNLTVRGTAVIPMSQMCETTVFLLTAGNSTVQCWGVQWNNVHNKSIKIFQLIIILKHQKHCHPKSLLASFSRWEVHSQNHRCSGKVISITHSECVSATLVVEHAMCMCCNILSFVACTDLPYFSTLPHKQKNFQFLILITKSVFWFHLQYFSKQHSF